MLKHLFIIWYSFLHPADGTLVDGKVDIMAPDKESAIQDAHIMGEVLGMEDFVIQKTMDCGHPSAMSDFN